MSDDGKKNDDVDLEYDASFDEFEEDEDFDESWDESEEDAPLKAASAKLSALASGAPKKKGFVQKNFNVIVLSGAVVIAGFFIFPMFGGNKTTPVVPASSDTLADKSPDVVITPENQEASSSELPPMPVPMDGAVSAPPADTSSAALTPMPGEEPATSQPVETAEAPLPVAEPAAAVPDSAPVPPPEAVAEDVLLAPPSETPAADAPVPAAEVVPAPAPSEPEKKDVASAVEAVSEVPVEPENITVKDDVQAAIEASIPADKPVEKTPVSDVAPEKTETVPPQPVAQEKMAEIIPSPAPVPEEKPVVRDVAEKAPPAVPAEKTKPKKIKPVSVKKPKPAPSWTLRSAQTGKAVIALKGTQDLQSVAVGDTVKGLGRITAIEQENGVWIVRTTQGSVFQ